MRLCITLAVALCASLQLAAQLPYLETFENNGEGLAGPCVDVPSSCNTYIAPTTGWSITGDVTGMAAASDYFMVVDYELEAQDTEGAICFLSPLIDISSATTVEFSVTLSEEDDHEGTDFADVTYIVDAVATLITNWNGLGDDDHTVIDDFESTTVEVGGLSGDALQIEICVRNNAGDERIIIDNVIVRDPAVGSPDVRINELDADTDGTDMEEFVELKGPVNQSLDHFVLVLFNGNDNLSHGTPVDLDGEVTDGLGYYVVCFGNNANSYCDTTVLQVLENGPDGVGLYYGKSASDFPDNTVPTTDGLLDGLRYETNDPDAPGLSFLDTDCDPVCQMNEDLNGNKDFHSIQRGSWFVAPPTPGGTNTPLPIELLDFQARHYRGDVRLQWTTASETHNAYFAIERSPEGRSWEVIAKLEGAHNSITTRHYQYDDKNVRPGMHYYRLRQVDEDGKSTLSGVRAVRISGAATVVFPSLTSDLVQIRLGEVQHAAISLLTMSGTQLQRMTVSDLPHTQMSLAHVPPGVYLIRIARADGIEVHRVIKR